jgi:hypothetical protein
MRVGSFLRHRLAGKTRSNALRTHERGEMKWGQSSASASAEGGKKVEHAYAAASAARFHLRSCSCSLSFILFLYSVHHVVSPGSLNSGSDRETNENEKEKEEKSANGMYSGDLRALVSLCCCYPVEFLSFNLTKYSELVVS